MLYREDLDKMKCASGHASKALWIHSACHTRATMWVWYEDGVIAMWCAICDAIIAEVAVAKKENSLP